MIIILLVAFLSDFAWNDEFIVRNILTDKDNKKKIDIYTMNNYSGIEKNIDQRDTDAHLDTFNDPMFKFFKPEKLNYLLPSPIELPTFLIDQTLSSDNKSVVHNRTFDDRSKNYSARHNHSDKDVNDTDFSIDVKKILRGEGEECVPSSVFSSSFFSLSSFSRDFHSISLSSSANFSSSCNLCPTLFTVDSYADCRSTFGIIPTIRGNSAVTSFTLNYEVNCLNNKSLTFDDIISLANLQVQSIEETARNYPEQYNIASITIYKVEETQKEFTLLLKLYINSFPLLTNLYRDLRSIALKDLNSTFCTATYKINSIFFNDINECEAGLDTCLPDQRCVNIIGTFICSCGVGKLFNINTCACDPFPCVPREGYNCLTFNGESFYFPADKEQSFRVIFIPTVIIFGLLLLIHFILLLARRRKRSESTSDSSSLSV